jgi:hypothetical protein
MNWMRKVLLFIPFLLAGSAFAADISGDYSGSSITDDGAYTAKVHLVLKKNADATWDCKFSLNVDGEDVPTKTTVCAVSDTKLSTEYDADVHETSMHLVFEAKAKDDKSLEGTFKALGKDGGDAIAQGTWKASPQQ